mmetsp:Transcript_39237/g.59297  ORF Transcript_39237/g.59297 Transcript_39237/m.59297 type:complete len:103 (+) Transcript_39237:111-419(+)
MAMSMTPPLWPNSTPTASNLSSNWEGSCGAKEVDYNSRAEQRKKEVEALQEALDYLLPKNTEAEADKGTLRWAVGNASSDRGEVHNDMRHDPPLACLWKMQV